MEWHDLFNKLKELYSSSDDIKYLIAPFINHNLLEKLFDKNKDVIIITSWRKDHLLIGVSSIETYDICKKNGWKLFINGRLHAKIYSNNLDTGYIGSANITKKALYESQNGNYEILEHVELDTQDKIEIHKLQANSILVDDNVYRQYEAWLESQEIPNELVKEDLELEANSDVFHTSQLPLTDNPGRLWELYNDEAPHADWEFPAAEHDLAYYSAPVDLDKEQFCGIIKERFFSHTFVSKFVSIIDNDGMRFGTIKEWIQNNCSDVPMPNRRELTFNTQSLMRWIVYLAPEEYEVVILGRYSEVLRRK